MDLLTLEMWSCGLRREFPERLQMRDRHGLRTGGASVQKLFLPPRASAERAEMAVMRLVSGITGLAGTTGVIPQEPTGGRPGKGFGSQTPSDASEDGSGTAEKRPASPAERRPRRPACCLPRPAVGKPVLLPVGWAPARPCQTPERPAGVPWPRQGARLPTHCRDGRREGAGPNQAEASGKRKSCAGPGLLPARDKAREARRCPGGHSQCVSLECGLTPKALRSDEAERPALGAA